MRVSALTVAGLMLGACVAPAYQGTRAEVFRFETVGGQTRFRACEIVLGWTESQLRVSCGEPVAEYPAASVPELRCLLFPTVARPIAAGQGGAPYFAACVSKTAPSTEPRVTAVFGLAAVPEIRAERSSTEREGGELR